MSSQYRLEFITRGSGFTVNEIAGETLGHHTVVYRNPAGTWSLADADAAATMPVIGITMGPISIGSKGEILIQGYIGDPSWTWVAGGEIYASVTAGELTQVAPPGIGDVIQVVAVAVEPDMVYFNSDLGNSGATAGNTIIVRENSGANIGNRPRLNFIEGFGIALTIADDAVNTEIDITIDNDDVIAHSARHEPAGADEVNDIDIGNTGVLLSAHKARHVVAGADPFAGGDLLDATARVGASRNGGADVGARRSINFVEGANITLTVADDGGNEEIDVTIAAAAASGFDFEDFYKVDNPDTNIGRHTAVALPDEIDTTVRHEFFIPSQVTSIDVAAVILVSAATGNIRRSAATDFGIITGGEDYNQHPDTVAAGQEALTADKITQIDITTALTAAAGGDLVGIEFTREASNVLDTIGDTVYYLGIYVRGS